MAATESGFSDNHPLVRPLDEEQSRLVEILLAAGGADVSFEELRRQGIENPAVLAYELEIAGLPIAHVQRTGPGSGPSSVGLRLDGHVAAGGFLGGARPRHADLRAPRVGRPTAMPGASTPASPRLRRPAAPGPGLLPVAVTVVAAIVLVILVVALVNGSGPSRRRGPATRSSRSRARSRLSRLPRRTGSTTAGATLAGAVAITARGRRHTPTRPKRRPPWVRPPSCSSRGASCWPKASTPPRSRSCGRRSARAASRRPTAPSRPRPGA